MLRRDKQKESKLTKFSRQARLFVAKQIIAFDLDGTLTKSKAPLDKETSSLLCELLQKKIVAVMGGGSYDQFKNQFLKYLKCPRNYLKNLFIFPTSGASLYRYQNNKWLEVYKCFLTEEEKKRIAAAFQKVFKDIHYTAPKKIYGKIIEDRESQITFSALGQKAPLEKKKEWNQKNDIRFQLKVALEKYLPDFEIRLGGLTSIDVTKKGIDKAYGISQLVNLFSLSSRELVYIGDALHEGGNDYVVKQAGVDTIEVDGPEETKDIIHLIISY